MPTAQFTVNNVYTTIISDIQADVKLDAAFKYFVNGAERNWQYKTGKWDGYTHLFASKIHRFPTGLLEDAKAALKGYTIKVIDTRVRPDHDVKPWNLKGADVREHQTEAIISAIEEGRGIIHHATGAGKTEVMAGIIQMVDLPALVLVHQKGIAEQTRDRLQQRIGKKVGLYAAGKREDQRIVSATFQTLMSQYNEDQINDTNVLVKWLSRFPIVAIDEAHHLSAKTFQQIVNLCPAYYRFAFSATPFRTGDKGTRLHVVGSTGPVLDHFSAGEGVEKGLLVKANITMLKWHPTSPSHNWDSKDFEVDDGIYMPNQYSKLYETAIVKSRTRNEAIVDAVAVMVDDGRKILVLVNRIDHGLWLKKAISKDTQKRVEFIHGVSDNNDRALAIRLLMDKTVKVVIATTIWDEGMDAAGLSGLVFAGAQKAQHSYLQRLGRGMRLATEKDDLQVIDFYDTNSKIMFRHSEERLKAYRSDSKAYSARIEDISNDNID